jgi:hypothetical protein
MKLRRRFFCSTATLSECDEQHFYAVARSPFAFWTRPAVTVGLIQRNKPPVYLVYPSLRVGEGVLRMTLPDYVAIGVLIVLILWAAVDWIPLGKL